MKRVRVLKDMPFAKVGEEFDISIDGFIIDNKCDGMYIGLDPSTFVRDGWLEWVEEPKSLEEKMKEHNIIKNVTASLVATSHFKQKLKYCKVPLSQEQRDGIYESLFGNSGGEECYDI